MSAILTSIIGYTAALVGTLLMLPQVVKSWKTKKVDDLSAAMLGMYFLNCTLWALYGALKVDGPLVICNSIAWLISVFQVIMKIKYRTKVA